MSEDADLISQSLPEPTFAPEGISVVNQLARGLQRTLDWVGQIAGHVFYPRPPGYGWIPALATRRDCEPVPLSLPERRPRRSVRPLRGAAGSRSRRSAERTGDPTRGIAGGGVSLVGCASQTRNAQG